MQPFLCTFCALLIISITRLEFIYQVLSGSKLICKFLSGPSCLLKVCLGNICRVVNQPKNGISRPVQLIGIRIRIFRFRSVRNNGSWHVRNLTSHPHPRSSHNLPRIFQSIQITDAIEPLWITFGVHGSRLAFPMT